MKKDRLRFDQRVSLCGLTKTNPMLHVIWYIIVGFIVGLLARAVMPGVQHLGFIMTTLLGIAGSIVGGLIARLFSRPEPGATFHPAGSDPVDHRRDHFAFYLGKIGASLTKSTTFVPGCSITA